jgi:hypothetical protein
MKIKIRRAKISDIPNLVDKLYEFYNVLKDRGARDVAHDDNVLRGGITIEIGNGFSNTNWFCIVADKGGEIIAFMIGILEFCSPTSEHFKCVRLHAGQLDNDSLIGPRVLLGMWGLMEDWAKESGAGYFYANVHPGNQPSVRAVKKVGFKHHYTQFYRPIELETSEEV